MVFKSKFLFNKYFTRFKSETIIHNELLSVISVVKMLLFSLVFFLGIVAAEINFAEEEHQLPPLFHLDDYNRCLANKDGLYCLGSFDLSPIARPHPKFDLMEAFTLERTNYNRTRIYRGYCVSSRCPTTAPAQDASERFERCAAKWAKQRALNATLRELQYCRQSDQKPTFELDASDLVFASLVGIIVSLNIIGTIYDVSGRKRDEKKEKNKLLISWSIRHNWRRLVKCPDDKSQISTWPGIKVILMLVMIQVHYGLLLHSAYLQNPIFFEQMSRHPMTMIIMNGSPSIQVYVILSTFFGACCLLRSSDGVGFGTLLRHIFRRFIRLTPIHLLVVGFAATWWRLVSDGPLWSAVVGHETSVCRRKLWSHALSISNLIEPEVTCIVPTWFICLDLQLYIVGAIFTALVARSRHAIPVLVVMFLASTSLNMALAYENDWTAMLYVVLSPEHLRTVFRYSPSYYNFYVSPWGGLPTCFLGLIAAVYCSRLSKNSCSSKHKAKESKTEKFQNLKPLGAVACIFVVFGWLMVGCFIKDVSSKLFLAAYASIERVVFLAIAGLAFWAGHQIQCLKSAMSWKPWVALSRLSLSVMLVHWAIIMTLIGQATTVVNVTLFTMILDGISIAFVTYILAVPLTLTVEMPVQMFFDSLI